MSGFVINFFANELKMFTQWMGETTGIVSVPEEENAGSKGEDVSFEGKVYNLEKYYHYIYNLCKDNIPEKELNDMAADFQKRFDTNDYKTQLDFKFLQALRSSFDKAFRNSISPQRSGYSINGVADKKVMRFNSSLGVFMPCAADKCVNCSNKDICRNKGKTDRNSFAQFADGVRTFFNLGQKFYTDEDKKYQEFLAKIRLDSADSKKYAEITGWLRDRKAQFKKAGEEVNKLLTDHNDQPFTMPFETYNSIFAPMKKLYWDGVVSYYIQLILSQFYKQCDSVLKGATLFEKFVKTLSIADFMNNMEGTL